MSEERFRLITENAVDLITIVDREGQRLYSSPSYQKVLGHTSDELEGTPRSFSKFIRMNASPSSLPFIRRSKAH